jgi:hypothetical protein
MEHMYGREQVTKLKPIKWEDVGDKVYAAMWTSMVQEHARWLGTLTADQIPSDKKWFIKKGAELASMHNRTDVAAGDHVEYSKHVLLCAIGAAAVKAGWTIDTAPGRPLNLSNGDARFEPHLALAQLAEGTMKVEEWKAKCESLGISGIPLAIHVNLPKTQSMIA